MLSLDDVKDKGVIVDCYFFGLCIWRDIYYYNGNVYVHEDSKEGETFYLLPKSNESYKVYTAYGRQLMKDKKTGQQNFPDMELQ